MLKASEVKGRAVVALSDGATLGHVDDVLFDATYRRVLGVRVKTGVWGHGTIVPRAAVVTMRPEAVTVPGPDTFTTDDRGEEVTAAVTLGQARGMKVVSEGGARIGTVTDIEMDDQAHFVTGYRLSVPGRHHLGHQERLMGAGQVLRLGEGGVLIVPDAVGQALHAS